MHQHPAALPVAEGPLFEARGSNEAMLGSWGNYFPREREGKGRTSWQVYSSHPAHLQKGGSARGGLMFTSYSQQPAAQKGGKGGKSFSKGTQALGNPPSFSPAEPRYRLVLDPLRLMPRRTRIGQCPIRASCRCPRR